MDALLKSFEEFKKYDWKIEINRQAPKKENEFDIIIVGAGLGGLACSAVLSKRGYRVLILEQHFLAGGFFTSYKRKDFEFSGGAEDITTFQENGAMKYFLGELNLKTEDFFEKNTRQFIFKGEKIEVGENPDDFIKRLQEIFPEEKDSIPLFFGEVKAALTEMNDRQDFGVVPPMEIVLKLYGFKAMNAFMGNKPNLSKWLTKTYQQKLDEYFKTEDIKKFLCALLGYVGTEAHETPGISALGACMAYYFYGGYHAKNGCQHFSDTIVEFIEKHGGVVLKKHRVDEILVENGEVRGVKSGDNKFYAPIVVSNCNARTTFLNLVKEENLPADYINYIKNLKLSNSVFMLSLALDMNLSHLPFILMDLDEMFGFITNTTQPLVPQGKSSIAVIDRANYHDYPERGTPEYKQKKQEVSDKLIDKLEKYIPDIRQHIIYQEAATPKTFERYVSVPEGAIYVFDQSPKTKRPCFKTPVKGLYLAGASVFPGGGVPSAVISGINAANDICGWKR